MSTHNQEPPGIPNFSCEPLNSSHSGPFYETAKALKATLCAAGKLIKELVVLLWKFIRLAALTFWDVKGRCWWKIAKDFTTQGYRAVQKDAFRK
ncbi:hypothetical protein [Desulfoplanes sp.]